MKQGRALPEVLKELQHQNNMKQDFIGPAQAFMLEPDGGQRRPSGRRTSFTDRLAVRLVSRQNTTT